MSPLPQSENDLPEPTPIRARFLPPGATTAQLIRANVLNHREWFTLNAQMNGGTVSKENGVTVLETSEEMLLAFPRLTGNAIDATLDRHIDRAFAQKPERVACWSVSPSSPRDLGARLAARGFEWGWRPHWMSLDLSTLKDEFPVPAGYEIAVDEIDDWEVSDLPYYDRAKDAAFRRLLAKSPKRFWRFSARKNGKVVAQTVLFVTTGAFGVGGIYNVGVVPAARRQGIGRAISAEACLLAKLLGCHYATLNSATHIYDALGFVSCGYGQTWWLHAKTLNVPPPTRSQIRFAEAIGRGELPTLRGLVRHSLTPDLDSPLPNGSTPIELAIRSGQPKTALWLSQHGATLDVIHALDLGLRDRIPQMLADNPALANRRFGGWQITPVHEAVSRNDLQLLEWLLTAKPDLSIRDTQFHSNALGWATHFGRTEMIERLKLHRL